MSASFIHCYETIPKVIGERGRGALSWKLLSRVQFLGQVVPVIQFQVIKSLARRRAEHLKEGRSGDVRVDDLLDVLHLGHKDGFLNNPLRDAKGDAAVP